jgi:hypothetical protein
MDTVANPSFIPRGIDWVGCCGFDGLEAYCAQRKEYLFDVPNIGLIPFPGR